jgi:protein TonB
VVGGVVGGVGKTLPPPPQPPAKGQPISVGASLAARRLITRVEPEYPRLAKAARLRGEVLLSVEIDTQGRVANVSVVRGHPLLTQAAVDAVRQWRYIPFVVNGVPAPVVTTVSVRFPPPRAAAEAARDRPGAVRLSDGRPRTSERG